MPNSTETMWVKQIDRTSFNRLYPHEDIPPKFSWLDDDVMNGFLQLMRKLDHDLCLESSAPAKRRTFFAPLIVLDYLVKDKNVFDKKVVKQYIYSALTIKKKKWSNIFQIPADEFKFIANMGDEHYIGLTFYRQENLILLYNPYLSEIGTTVAKALRAWLFDEYNLFSKIEDSDNPINPIRIECRKKPYPLQRNSKDCGVFVLASFLCDITNTPQIFNQGDMHILRHLIIQSIIRGKIDVSNFHAINLLYLALF